MKRRWWHVIAMSVGVAAGVVGIAMAADSEIPGSTTPLPASGTVRMSGSTSITESSDAHGGEATLPSSDLKPAPPQSGTALVWSSGRLPFGIEDEVGSIDGVTDVTRVDVATLFVEEVTDADGLHSGQPTPGWLIPIEIAAIDPAKAPAELSALATGAAFLSETSAALRGVGGGARIDLEGGTELHVAGVVSDEVLGAPEVIVSRQAAEAIGGFTPRFLLIEFDGDRAAIERTVLTLFPADLPVRFRGPGETPFLRHADAVLPQAIVKSVFGEFMVRRDGDRLTIDPGWFDENIVTEDLPIVGSVTCHRSIMPLLRTALQHLVDDGSAGIVDSDGFQGCWNPRTIAGSDMLSRHSWGAAIDINHADNPRGHASVIDQRLIDEFTALGFTWGGDWLVPDPAHFEWVGR